MHVLFLDVPVAVERLARTFLSDERQQEVSGRFAFLGREPQLLGQIVSIQVRVT